MNRNTLIGLAVAAALALVGAIALQLSHKPRSASDGSPPGGALVPALVDHVNDVDKIVVTTAGNAVQATLARGPQGWTLQEKGGYVVDTGKLRAFLLRLADARLLEAKTANKERHAALGVEDVAAADAKGVQVELGGLAQPVKLVIGEANARGGGTFVRRADEAQGWLATGSLAPEKAAVDWLARDLVDIDAARIAEVELTGADGKVVRAAKEAEGDANFRLVDVPRGREPASDYAVNSLASGLDALRFDDVVPADQAVPPEAARKARYTTFDGLVVEVVAWEADGKHYARFAASTDEARATRHVETAQAEAKAKHEAEKAAAPASDGEPADVPAAPLAVSDPAKDRDERLARLREQQASLQRRFEGWTFVVPAYKYAAMDKSLDDLLKPVEDNKPAATKTKAGGK